MSEEAELRRRAFERLAARTHSALSRILPAVCPVLIPNKRGDPEVVGSAVLLRVGPSEFIVTAAHVMDIARNSFYVGAETNIVAISGRFTHTDAPNGSRDDDRFDLAVLPLAEHEVAGFKECHFLSLDELEPRELTDYQPIVGSKYLMVGYPCTKQRIASDGVLDVEPLRFVANARPESEYSAKWSTNDHLIIDFDKKGSTSVNGKVTPPDPYGVSGGGIFRIRGLLDGEPASEQFVAVPIRYTGKAGKSVIGTRIGPLLLHIATEYPQLAPYIHRRFRRASP